ncbi:hypothetical protein DM558_00825 [Entomomonas moraniae]|uniref:Type 4 fimbrial biogenesis protein PilX N-terminal domain-containing protein n=1 Tax=Entomomonas moraniae TaxID=2213226 RepID=A0A3S9XAH1_9GAMM|nr:hypothetical protein [Entomomonas moraniae]AZS49410.1 hypothetical protein DM558_00825 [Entomomonas moraniae]
MATFSQFKQQKGATLIVVLLLLLIIMLLALSIATSTTSRSLIVNTNVLNAQATEAAETGSDVLLRLLKDGTLDKKDIPDCGSGSPYSAQFNKNTTIASNTEDKRAVTLSWYACKAKPPGTNEMCTETTVTGCFAVVITGVACFGNITDPENEACTVRRYLQGYAFKK